MAKIDCSVTVNYLQEAYRMCKYYDHECDKCPASVMNNSYNQICKTLFTNYPERAVEIVQKWSDEHPVKTRFDDLLEKYPGVVVENNDRPIFYPAMLGYCNNCNLCKYGEGDTRTLCWNEPVDGGATGKAVE